MFGMICYILWVAFVILLTPKDIPPYDFKKHRGNANGHSVDEN